jgi:hypothetical protein
MKIEDHGPDDLARADRYLCEAGVPQPRAVILASSSRVGSFRMVIVGGSMHYWMEPLVHEAMV